MSIAQLNIHGSLVRSVAPTLEPLTVAEAKTHLRVDHDEDDSHIADLIAMARATVEDDAEVSLMSQTWQLRLDCFPDVIEMRRPTVLPSSASISSVTSIGYTDANGDSQTLSSSLYDTDLYSRPGRITPAYGQVWPTVQSGTMNVITVTYVAGQSAASSVDARAKHAMRLLLTDAYDMRAETDYDSRSLSGAAALSYWSLIDGIRWRPRF